MSSAFSDVIEYLSDCRGIYKTTAERRAFALHLTKVIKALQSIEKVDLGYSLRGHENDPINECIYDFESQDIIETE